MRFDLHSFDDFKQAIATYDHNRGEALILVLHTPGEICYRFIVTTHGIEKQDCNKAGEPLYDPNTGTFK